MVLFTGRWTAKPAVPVFPGHIALERTRFGLRVTRKGSDHWPAILTDNTIHLLFLWLIAGYVAWEPAFRRQGKSVGPGYPPVTREGRDPCG